MAAENITYSYGPIDTAVSNIDSFISTMSSSLSDLETQLRPLETDWTADAQTSYLACKTKWRQNAQDLIDILTQLKTSLGQAGTTMQSADTTAANTMFSF